MTSESNEVEKKVKNMDLLRLQTRFLWFSLMMIAFLVAAVGLVAYFYSKEIHLVSRWILEHFGFTSLAAIIYLSDTFVSPVPPDLLLFIVANSALAEDWMLYVSILALCSLLAGYTAWILGYFLSKRNWVPAMLNEMAAKNRKYIELYGAWAVALGALTPFPFSITCWTAGFMHMNIKTFSLGAITRVPRIFIYYWAIESALWIPAHLPEF